MNRRFTDVVRVGSDCFFNQRLKDRRQRARVVQASRLIAALALLALPPRLAFGADAASSNAHVSSSVWTVDGATVRVRVMIPTAAARKLVSASAPPPGLAAVAAAVSRGFTVTTPAGDCEAVDQGEGVGQIYTLALTPGLDRFEIVFTCPQSSGLTLKDDLLFDRDPGHIDFAKIRIGAGKPVLQAFTAERRTIPLPAAAPILRGADPVPFARQAAIRLAENLAALGIVLGCVLLSRRWLDLAWLAATLGVGYAASFALGLSGLVMLDQGLAGALGGLLAAILGLIVLLSRPRATGSHRGWRVGVMAAVTLSLVGLVVAAGFKSPSAALATFGVAAFALGAAWTGRLSPRLSAARFAPAALFAFLDGLGPASDLSLLHPAPGQMIPILAGHDVGGLASAMVIAGFAMGAVRLAGRRLRAWRGLASEVGGAALIGLELFWFVTRLYS